MPTLKLLLLLLLLPLLNCSGAGFGAFGKLGNQLTVTLTPNPNSPAILDASKLQASISTGRLSSGDVELRQITLEYKIPRQNLLQCEQLIQNCNANIDDACLQNPLNCPTLKQNCPQMLQACEKILPLCPSTFKQCKTLFASCPQDDPSCQKTPSGCRLLLQQCEEARLCPWASKEDPELIKCLNIPNLRLEEPFEQCSAKLNAGDICTFQTQQTKTFSLQVLSQNDGYNVTTNNDWKEACGVPKTAQLLLFVGFKGDPNTSNALRPNTPSNSSTLPPFILRCLP